MQIKSWASAHPRRKLTKLYVCSALPAEADAAEREASEASEAAAAGIGSSDDDDDDVDDRGGGAKRKSKAKEKGQKEQKVPIEQRQVKVSVDMCCLRRPKAAPQIDAKLFNQKKKPTGARVDRDLLCTTRAEICEGGFECMQQALLDLCEQAFDFEMDELVTVGFGYYETASRLVTIKRDAHVNAYADDTGKLKPLWIVCHPSEAEPRRPRVESDEVDSDEEDGGGQAFKDATPLLNAAQDKLIGLLVPGRRYRGRPMTAFDRLVANFPEPAITGCLEAMVRAEHTPQAAKKVWTHPHTGEDLAEQDPPLWNVTCLRDTELPPVNSEGKFFDYRLSRIKKGCWDAFPGWDPVLQQPKPGWSLLSRRSHARDDSSSSHARDDSSSSHARDDSSSSHAHANARDDADNLPYGWQRGLDSAGRPYFYNLSTHTSQWDPPLPPPPPAPAPSLPAGWFLVQDQRTGHPYYYHHASGYVQWEPPTAT